MEKAYAAWRAFQDKILARAAALILIGCTLLALLEVVRRYVFGFSFEWQQDAVTFFILSAIFLYFAISQRHNEHLNVVLLLELLQAGGEGAKKAAEVIKLVALVISFLFMLAVVWWGYPEVEDSIKYASRTESLAFPLAPFLATLLAGFALMAVTMAFQIWFEIQKLRGRQVPEEAPVLDRMPD
ncbi:MAG: TRAP transporter small permease [Betaproteobacteria bacterium]|nr:TRAP transporter small permease [Betaproteobacteria bacterium]MDH5352551.1 TRAP transporter small permease [Betaproteobacteria bacterium]